MQAMLVPLCQPRAHKWIRVWHSTNCAWVAENAKSVSENIGSPLYDFTVNQHQTHGSAHKGIRPSPLTILTADVQLLLDKQAREKVHGPNFLIIVLFKLFLIPKKLVESAILELRNLEINWMAVIPWNNCHFARFLWSVPRSHLKTKGDTAFSFIMIISLH